MLRKIYKHRGGGPYLTPTERHCCFQPELLTTTFFYSNKLRQEPAPTGVAPTVNAQPVTGPTEKSLCLRRILIQKNQATVPTDLGGEGNAVVLRDGYACILAPRRRTVGLLRHFRLGARGLIRCLVEFSREIWCDGSKNDFAEFPLS